MSRDINLEPFDRLYAGFVFDLRHGVMESDGTLVQALMHCKGYSITLEKKDIALEIAKLHQLLSRGVFSHRKKDTHERLVILHCRLSQLNGLSAEYTLKEVKDYLPFSIAEGLGAMADIGEEKFRESVLKSQIYGGLHEGRVYMEHNRLVEGDRSERGLSSKMEHEYIVRTNPDPDVIKGDTGPEKAGWKFFQLLGLGIAFVLLTWVSHVTADVAGWSAWGFFFGWLCATASILFLFVFLFHVAWYAYKRGAFES